MRMWGVVVVLMILAKAAVSLSVAQEPIPQVPLKGTLVRPADGIRSPMLDRAWGDYRRVISEATDQVRAVLLKKEAAAMAEGDRERVLLVKRQLKRFDEEGILPGESSLQMERDLRLTGLAFRKANASLLTAYGELEKELTRENRLSAASVAADERGAIERELSFPPMPNVPEPLFDGKTWIGWGVGWGGGGHQVVPGEKLIRLEGTKCFAHQSLLADRVTFELDVRNRVWDHPNSSVQAGFQTIDGGYLVRVPGRDAQGRPTPGEGELLFFDNAIKQENALGRFRCPPTVNAWQTWQVIRDGSLMSVSIDGKLVAKDLRLPQPVLTDCNLHLGVINGAADFRNLRVTVRE